MDIEKQFDLKARVALGRALQVTRDNHYEVTSLGIFVSILELEDSNIESIFLASGISREEIKKKCRKCFMPRDLNIPIDAQSVFSENSKQILNESLRLKEQRFTEKVSVEDIFLATISSTEMRIILPQILGIGIKSLIDYAWKLLGLQEIPGSSEEALIRNLRLQVSQASRVLRDLDLQLIKMESKLRKVNDNGGGDLEE